MIGLGTLTQLGIISLTFIFLYMNSSTLFMDIVFAFIKFSLKLLQLLLGWGVGILEHITNIVVYIYPYVWKICCILVGFLKWMIKQLAKGIFGTGNQFLTVLSWLFLMCACILYFENIFLRSNSRRTLFDYATVEAENHQNARREIDQQERREILENEENENEENSNEEAEINLAADDNDRNAVRELERTQFDNNRGQHIVQRPQNLVASRNQLFVRLPERRSAASSSDSGSESDSDDSPFSALRQRNHNVIRRRRRHHSQSNTLCIVCFERERGIALFPCGHLQLCTQCIIHILRNNAVCPLCQTRIEEHRRVYL